MLDVPGLTRRAEIAGGGFAGLTAAIALAQRGWRVGVHERASAWRASGFGIAIHENGIRVLDALGVADAVLDEAMRVSRLVTVDQTGATVAEVPVRGRTYRVSRQRLIDVLAAHAQVMGVELHLGSAGVAADPSGALKLGDGRNLQADLVVAADGVHSALRDSLGLTRRRVRLGDGALRLVIPRLAEEAAREPDGSAAAYEHWSGHRRVIYNACSPSEAYVAMSCLARDQTGRATPVDLASWRAAFAHLGPVFDAMASLARSGEVGWDEVSWRPFEIVKLKRWSAGRVAVIGDAAHAMPPNLGQGAGVSMMNALALAVHLDREGEIAAALQRWEAAERPLTEHTQRWSTMYSRLSSWPSRARSAVFSLSGRSAWLRSQMQRTALHTPTGAQA